MQGETRALHIRVWRQVKHQLHVVRHYAHSLGHPVHLGYFGMMVFHFDYKIAALGCLIVGLAAMLPDLPE